MKVKLGPLREVLNMGRSKEVFEKQQGSLGEVRRHDIHILSRPPLQILTRIILLPVS